MIAATELRIGNWIQDLECEPYHFQVEELRKYVGYSIWAYYRNGSVKSKEVEGIPFNKDWFFKFGGVEESANRYYFGKLMFSISTMGIFKFHYSGKVVYIDYVHNFQNLIHALTGKELELKPEP